MGITVQTAKQVPPYISLDRAIRVMYKNWKGEVSERTIVPTGILRWGKTEWYSQEQWLMQVWDVDRGDYRDYALCAIQQFLTLEKK